MSLGYAVEAWVLAVVQWAYVTVRALAARSTAEELCAYGGLLCSSLNLLGHAASTTYPQHPYFVLQASVTLFFVFLLASGMDGWPSDTSSIPPSLSFRDCPNLDASKMFRRDFFGDSDFHIAPGAVTLAFQTMQVLVSASALHPGCMWPGHALGYACLSYLGALYALRFGGALQAPCPGGYVTLFGVWDVNISAAFACMSFTLLMWIALEAVALSSYSRIASRSLGSLLAFSLAVSSLYVSSGRNMLTPPLVFYSLGSLLMSITGLIPAAPAPQEPAQEQRRTVRWVVPPSLPKPLVMDDFGRDNVRSKKRL